jgi:hypothetical protein
LRIGLSILTRAGDSLWNSGIGQNVLHLAELLEALPFIERVSLIDCGDHGAVPADAPDWARRFPVLSPAQAEEADLDVALEMAGGLDPAWIARFRARGGKLVWHICGQPYAGLIEPSLFGRPGYWSDAQRADEIWLLPKDEAFAPLMRAVHRCPVRIAPYLWSRRVLDMSIRALGAEGARFGHRADAGGAAIAVFEPNISPIKTCLPAMLICDQAERLRPGAVASLRLYNTLHLAGQRTFDAALESLDLHKAGKVTLAERDYFVRAMGMASIVVSHQLACAQNYLYLDALAGGYPLVHNSALFRDVGYYYEGDDLDAGARQILHAIDAHAAQRARYEQASARVMARLDPAHPDNRSAYARLLLSLTQGGRGRAA